MKIYKIGTQVIQNPGSIPDEYNDLNENMQQQ
ncbi:MAG: hypothetical protein ACI94Y_000832 [Maribacter sp.]|jgi:hypothetical protein